MSKIKAVIFDLWETLGTKNISISKTFQSKFNLTPSSDFLTRYEESIQLKKWENEIDAAISLLTAFNEPLVPENISFVTNLLNQGIKQASIFSGMKELLLDLSQKYKLGLLSNTTNFESIVLNNWGIDTLFSEKVFSWELNSLKPSVINYQAICSKLNVQPSECIFVDDSIVNVNAALVYGMSGKLFTSFDKLKSELNSLAI